jgi:hypothetical protein
MRLPRTSAEQRVRPGIARHRVSRTGAGAIPSKGASVTLSENVGENVGEKGEYVSVGEKRQSGCTRWDSPSQGCSVPPGLDAP